MAARKAATQKPARRSSAPAASRRAKTRAADARGPAPGAASRDPTGASTPAWFDALIERARERGRIRAGVAQARFPKKTRRELGEELVRAAALRAGLLGAATGTLALVTLPVGLPAGVAATLFVEAELLFALLALHGHDGGGEVGRVRLAALWAGAGFADAAKSLGLRATAGLFGRAIAGTLPARLIARLEPVLLRAILKRLGLGFLPRLFKLWPIVGAPFAFALDRAALRALGESALDALDGAAA